jgi:hypothetical protein
LEVALHSPVRFAVLLALLAVVVSGLLPAQKKAKAEIVFLDPDKIERPTKEDAQGVLQWVEWKKDPCPSCKGQKTTPCLLCERIDDNKHCTECGGKRVATCRTCGGAGSIPDPLDKASCPGCHGAGFFICMICGGGGYLKVEGSGDHPLACPGCRGECGYKCTVCGGARLVETAALKPSLKEAPLAALQKAKEQVDGVLKAVTAFAPTKDPRKDSKTFGKLLTPAGSVLPTLQKSGKLCEDVMGKTLAGVQFVGHVDHETNALKLMQDNHTYYLKCVMRMLDLAIARAEKNEKAAAEKPKKD